MYILHLIEYEINDYFVDFAIGIRLKIKFF